MALPVVLLGLGFTTKRLARRLGELDVAVYAAVRAADRFAEFERMGVRLCGLMPDELPKGAVLVHTVPPLAEPEKSALRTLILAIAPARILYISSTGVYGAQSHVDENTPVAPNDEKGRARVDEENWLASTPTSPSFSSLILRSAAIYGPGRGLHVRLREGRLQKETMPRGAEGLVSRIHVDDLVALLEAGIYSDVGGAWPVADEYPATSGEVVSWCADQMGLPEPRDMGTFDSRSGRSVDGRKIRELLGVKLMYPSYRSGIAVSLIEESRAGLEL